MLAAAFGLIRAAAEEAVGGARLTLVWASQTGTVEDYVPRCTELLTEAGFTGRDDDDDPI